MVQESQRPAGRLLVHQLCSKRMSIPLEMLMTSTSTGVEVAGGVEAVAGDPVQSDRDTRCDDGRRGVADDDAGRSEGFGTWCRGLRSDPFPNDASFKFDGSEGPRLLTAVGDRLLVWNLDTAQWPTIACPLWPSPRGEPSDSRPQPVGTMSGPPWAVPSSSKVVSHGHQRIPR